MIYAHSLYKLVFDSNISRKSFIQKVVKEMSKPYADSRIMLHAKNVLPSNVSVHKTCQSDSVMEAKQSGHVKNAKNECVVNVKVNKPFARNVREPKSKKLRKD